MKPRPRTASRVPRPLLSGLVLALALGLRVANLIDISDSPFFTRPVVDGRAYDRWALAIIGRAESPQAEATANGPFYQDPLYPYFLALIYTVFGHSYWAVYLLQFALALVFLLLVYDTARRLFDWRAGIAAAAMAALYKPFIFYESQIEKTALAIFLTALFLWLFVKALSLKPHPSSRRPDVGHMLWPFASGIALGLAALTRANTLLFAPLLPLAYLLNRPRSSVPPSSSSPHRSSFILHRSRLVPPLASILGVLLVIAPVSIRNSLLTHEFTLTTTQAGQNLYIGNSPYNATGQYRAPPWVRPAPEFEQQDFADYARKTANRGVSPGQVSRFYVRAALDWAKTRPGAFARLLWRKTVLYFNTYEVPDSQDIYFFSRYSWVLRLPLLSFGIVFGLGFAAMILTARGLGRLSFVIFFIGYAASVIAFFVFSRYRIPALPALLPFAGAMLPWLADNARPRSPSTADRSSFPPRLAGGLALILAAFALTLYPVRRMGKPETAQSLAILASDLYHEGDTAEAIATYEEALRNQPGQAEASRNLGIIMLSRNDAARAFQLFSDAVRADPSDPGDHIQLGKLYQRQGKPEAARVEFRKAIALEPGRAEYRFDLASALQVVDSYPHALAQYDTMLQLAPDNPVVRHNYAVCLYNLGRLDEARTQLEFARRLGSPVNPKFDSLLNSGYRPNR